MPGILLGVKFQAHVFFWGDHNDVLVDHPITCTPGVPPWERNLDFSSLQGKQYLVQEIRYS